MTRITATEAQRQFSDILNRVRYRGEEFEVMRGGETVARIEPPRQRFTTVGELRQLWKTLPKLDPEEAKRFEEDLRQIRAGAKMQDPKWE
jgi:antitoxin (DNA-binding transcriptional repressor) of toxin-antitoxin stability system